jgi:hypothetical protein
MKEPDVRSRRLVGALANALAEFHGEEPGKLSCWIQAVTMLIEAGPLRDHEVGDFFRTTIHEPPRLRVISDNSNRGEESDIPF